VSVVANSVPIVHALRASDPAQRRSWDELLDHAPSPDPYFRPGYAAAYEASGQGTAVAVVAQAGPVRVLFPLLLSSLEDLRFTHSVAGQDAITPYGYGGTIALDRGEPDWPAAIRGLRSWCDDNEIVACLFRLHPLMEESRSLRAAAPSLGLEVRFRGHTTALDLSAWDDARSCPQGMGKGRLSDLSKARRALRLSWGERPADLQLFRDLYESTMDRVQAGGFYRYPLAYYEALAAGLDNRFLLAMVWSGDELAGAALFLCEGLCMHYHLSCSNELGRELRATTLLIQAGAARGRERGCRYLHLGGGARPDDSLWGFKRSFGGAQLEYHFATMTVDGRAYDQLVGAREAAPDLPPPTDNFLRYRT